MNSDRMEQIVSLAKRRGFIWQGSDVYGGMRGTWDYGPLGVALKHKIMQEWWSFWVEERSDMYGVDAAIIMNPKVWQASGHVATFSDPLVEDLKTGERYRADHLLKDSGVNAEGLSNEQLTAKIKEYGVKSPNGNELSEVRNFNMMFQTNVGAVVNDNSVAYLRPETAQGIFTNYKNVVDSFYPDLPFGIAQQGKAFRNEISPRDFVFRSREFEQMEIEYFVNPNNWQQDFDSLLSSTYKFLTEKMGLNANDIHELDVPEEDRAHYSKKTIDIEFDYPIGREELMGIAYRTDFDLSNIARVSGKNMEYVDKNSKEKFIPHVIEPSFGVERLLMAILSTAYTEVQEDGKTRTYLKFPDNLAPISIIVAPLLKNKPALVEKAKEVYNQLRKKYNNVSLDMSGKIGKVYAKADEIGVPKVVVIDFDTIEKDGQVSVRNRDDASQIRQKADEI
ncbi:glycine--tRNA ligase [Candidatus Nanogingivalis gingivitcus]|jgi:glycine--tRNA ligase|uniref:glycine--tRNA ligase n=1 Tax=Candidatus Nanogingivalis gingivitcus TaxID=2171992 RepID=A0ABY0FJF5_9BACT|nr:glycine--tRNA ligase [Candidatus Nanogingivalis gingivitcus]RYC72371.1 Glycine--tRNA ligase [Candidatus Nanogingivalis gingivitcus]